MATKRGSKKKSSPKATRRVKDLTPKKGVKAGTTRSNQGWGTWEINPTPILKGQG